MLDSICPPAKRDEILYQWKFDEHLLKRNEFIGVQYNAFLEHRDREHLVKKMCIRDRARTDICPDPARNTRRCLS